MSLNNFLSETLGREGRPISEPHIVVNEDKRIWQHYGYRVERCQRCKSEFIIARGVMASDCGTYHKS